MAYRIKGQFASLNDSHVNAWMRQKSQPMRYTNLVAGTMASMNAAANAGSHDAHIRAWINQGPQSMRYADPAVANTARQNAAKMTGLRTRIFSKIKAMPRWAKIGAIGIGGIAGAKAVFGDRKSNGPSYYGY